MTEKELIEGYRKVLIRYIPQQAAELIAQWVRLYNFDLKITVGRATKLGDYRSPVNGKRHLITINHNLNQYAFLVTLIHEIAHLTAFQKFGHRIKPHGNEWKLEFKLLMQPFFGKAILPEDVEKSLMEYLINPAASTCTDEQLYKTLKKYNAQSDLLVHLEELPDKAIFKLSPERYFEKGERLRKRYKCTEIATKKIYLFSPIAEVMAVTNPLF